jgi:hypothetical protein
LTINVTIEEVVRQRWKLRVSARSTASCSEFALSYTRRHHQEVLAQTSEEDRDRLDALLETEPPRRSVFNDLKQPPKRPSLAHLDQLLTHLNWLESLGGKTSLLAGIPPGKVGLPDTSRATPSHLEPLGKPEKQQQGDDDRGGGADDSQDAQGPRAGYGVRDCQPARGQ